ncbi:MAG: response regulator [Chloroflexi bacterium]|nr:response regulator [Chloroflexota bacterium]
MSKLIMVIDDSLTVCKIVETCLEREGYKVKSFHDGIEVLRWLMGPEACIPRLMFLDIGLPKMDGYTVIQTLKQMPEFGDTVFVMISRYDGMVDRLKARLAGARGFLRKPFAPQDLIALAQDYVV